MDDRVGVSRPISDYPRKKPNWQKRTPLVVSFSIAMLVLIVALPSALNLPQSNPNTVPQFAPVPSDEGAQSNGGNLSSLGVTSGRGVQSQPLEDSLAGVARGTRPITKLCLGKPPRQTSDPNSPPCVAFFDGDNGGATYRGVTAEEIRVVITINGGDYYSQGETVEQAPADGTYCDFDLPPDSGHPGCSIRNEQRDHAFVRANRALAKFFNSRYQTYDRRVHYWVHWSDRSSPAARRAEAAEIDTRLKPFAVVDAHIGTYREEYADALAQRGILYFIDLSRLPASFFRKVAPLAWNFGPDVEHWVDGYVGYICKRVAPFPVDHAIGGIANDGQPMEGKRRRYGFFWTPDQRHPGFRLFADLARPGLRQCGVVAEVEAQFAQDQGTSGDASVAVAQFRQNDVTTILWFGGVDFFLSEAGDAAKYYPEVVIAGDRYMDAIQGAQLQNQTWWRNVWVVTSNIREDSLEESFGFQACREGEPSLSRGDCNYGTQFYRAHFMLLKAIQASGPRLTPARVDQGMHSIQRRASSSPYQSACFFDPDDYTCTKDSMETWWDSAAVNRSAVPNGCYRMVSEGARFLPDDWPSEDIVFDNANDPCNSFGGI